MKKLHAYFSAILSVCIISIVSMQAQTPSELRRMRQQAASDSASSNQQNKPQSASDRHRSRQQDQQDQKVYGDDDNMFSSTSIPDKWKNESAVVLGLKVSYVYYTKGQNYNFDETVRERIKLLDKAAVEDYSYFYFTTDYLGGADKVGFRIIKKDGSINKVDLSRAVDMGTDDVVPTYEHLYGGYNVVRYKKIAISNLEPGDIVDYYYQFQYQIQRIGQKATIYPEEISTLPGEFPIVSQKIDFQVERGFYINFVSYNGAPELQQGDDINHRTKTFSFTDNNREKEKSERFEFEYRSEPAIKFQIVYTSQSQQDEVNYFLSKPFVPLTHVDPDMVQKVANRMALESDDGAENNANAIIRYMRKNHGNVRDNIEYMKYAYYYYRYITIGKSLQTPYQFENSDQSSAYGRYSSYIRTRTQPSEDISIRDEAFVKTMGLVCRDRKIDYDFLFTVPRTVSTLDNLLTTDETRWVFHVKETPDVYFYPFDRYRNPNEGIGILEGADAYVITPNRNSRVSQLDKKTLPNSKYTDNSYSYDMNITLTPAMDGDAIVKRTATIKGQAKNYYYPEVVTEDSYENADIVRYRDTKDEETDAEIVAKIHNSNKHDEAVRKLKESADEQNKKRMDKMKEDAENDYSIDTYDDFNLIADGREMDSTTLLFNESFKIKDIVKKAGPNYLVSVGAFVGKEINIKDTEMDRMYDIYLRYPQTNNNHITFTIPDGYQVDGVSNLNVNITNSTGGFTSDAKVTGNKLTITTQKYYASNYLPKSSWPDMVKFIRAAYDFSQKKILLKKTGK